MEALLSGKQIDLTIKNGWYVISVEGDMIARFTSEDAVEKAVLKLQTNHGLA